VEAMGEQAARAVIDGNAGLVAAGFYAEDIHGRAFYRRSGGFPLAIAGISR
jgi:hypothetical protein